MDLWTDNESLLGSGLSEGERVRLGEVARGQTIELASAHPDGSVHFVIPLAGIHETWTDGTNIFVTFDGDARTYTLETS